MRNWEPIPTGFHRTPLRSLQWEVTPGRRHFLSSSSVSGLLRRACPLCINKSDFGRLWVPPWWLSFTGLKCYWGFSELFLVMHQGPNPIIMCMFEPPWISPTLDFSVPCEMGFALNQGFDDYFGPLASSLLFVSQDSGVVNLTLWDYRFVLGGLGKKNIYSYIKNMYKYIYNYFFSSKTKTDFFWD